MTDQTNSKDIISLISSLLPPNEATLSSPNDAIAALTHAVLVRSGFSLREVIGVVQAQSNVLPPEWAEPAPDSPKDHGFKYTHAQSAEFMVKVIALGRKVAILGSTVEDDQIRFVSFPFDRYINIASFPLRTTEQSAESLAQLFISPSNLEELAATIFQAILKAPAPSSQPPSTQPQQSEPKIQGHDVEPAALPRVGGIPSQSYPLPSVGDLTGQTPHPARGTIGSGDLEPLGGQIGSGAIGGIGGNGGGGGMLANFQDLREMDSRRAGQPYDPMSGSFLPPGAVPPGARFDPITPLGPGAGLPGRGQGGFGNIGGGQGGFGQRGPRSGEPDFDEFLPPRGTGYDDSMFS